MSTIDLPLITVISPCYNHAKYVIESLESIRNQTYPNIEHIIIDDYSIDDSVEKIENWIKVTDYDCIFIKHTVNKGISATLNESIRLAKGEYWTVLATDDIAFPSKFQQLFELLSSNPSFDMSVSDAGFIDNESMPSKMGNANSFIDHYSNNLNKFDINKFGSYDSLIFGNYIPGSILIKKNALFEVGLYDENLKMEDWDIWLRLSKRNHFLYTPEKLTFYRCHDSNSINVLKNNILLDSARILIREEEYCERNNISIKDKVAHAIIYLIERKLYLKALLFTLKSRHRLYIFKSILRRD